MVEFIAFADRHAFGFAVTLIALSVIWGITITDVFQSLARIGKK